MEEVKERKKEEARQIGRTRKGRREDARQRGGREERVGAANEVEE